MSRVTDERRWDTNFIEQMRLWMASIEGLADLAQVIVETVRAAIADTADRYDLTVVACYTTMDVGFPLCSVLRTPLAPISIGKAGSTDREMNTWAMV
jgi:hypothetical protein